MHLKIAQSQSMDSQDLLKKEIKTERSKLDLM